VFLSGIETGRSEYGLWIDGFKNVINVHNIQIRNCSFNNVAKPNILIGAEKPVFDEFRINGELQK